MSTNPIVMLPSEQIELVRLLERNAAFLVALVRILIQQSNLDPTLRGLCLGPWNKFLSDFARRSPVQGLLKDCVLMEQFLLQLIERKKVANLYELRRLYPLLVTVLIEERMYDRPEHPKWVYLVPILCELRRFCDYLNMIPEYDDHDQSFEDVVPIIDDTQISCWFPNAPVRRLLATYANSSSEFGSCCTKNAPYNRVRLPGVR